MKTLQTKSYIFRVEEEDGKVVLYVVASHVFGGKWNLINESNPWQGTDSLVGSYGGSAKILASCREQTLDDIKAYIERRKDEGKRQMESEAEKAEARRIEIEDEYRRVFSNEPTVTNADSVYVLLRYLNSKNWGSWVLPAMTIGYSCHQYDCDGRMATTIKLDEPIRVAGEEGTMFQYGAPRGHLAKYRRTVPIED